MPKSNGTKGTQTCQRMRERVEASETIRERNNTRKEDERRVITPLAMTLNEETIRLLEKHQLSPYREASPAERKRLQAALASARCIANFAAEWARDQLVSIQEIGASHHSIKLVVLDFASDSNPGGGWRGKQQGTQEESICFVSSLGLSLERLATANAGHYSIPSAGCVYVPDVTVVRHDNTWRDAPFWCSVVAAALRHTDGNYEFILSKIRGVLAAGTSQGHIAFIGGAWGCGAFGNDATLVAKAWGVAAKRTPCLEMLVLALPSKPLMNTFQTILPEAIFAGAPHEQPKSVFF